jgi:hypothetical protein
LASNLLTGVSSRAWSRAIRWGTTATAIEHIHATEQQEQQDEYHNYDEGNESTTWTTAFNYFATLRFRPVYDYGFFFYHKNLLSYTLRG